MMPETEQRLLGGAAAKLAQFELCARIAHTLANAPIHDHLGYQALAYLKLPGPDYRVLLRALHLTLRPKTYVEIGVRDGDTLHLAAPGTHCVGIDPAPTEKAARKNTALYITKSDDFFTGEQSINRMDRIRGFGLALIDGDHSYEQARRDFEHLESCAGPGSVIALHDVIPMDERTSTPDCKTAFWTGDVWKLMAEIVMHRKDLVAFTVACPPTGLGIVGKFTPEHRGLPEPNGWNFGIGPAGIGQVPSWEQQLGLLNIVNNDGDAVLRGFNAVQ